MELNVPNVVIGGGIGVDGLIDRAEAHIVIFLGDGDGGVLHVAEGGDDQVVALLAHGADVIFEAGGRGLQLVDINAEVCGGTVSAVGQVIHGTLVTKRLVDNESNLQGSGVTADRGSGALGVGGVLVAASSKA